MLPESYSLLPLQDVEAMGLASSGLETSKIRELVKSEAILGLTPEALVNTKFRLADVQPSVNFTNIFEQLLR